MTSAGGSSRKSATSNIACSGTQPYACWIACSAGRSAACLVSYRGRIRSVRSERIASVRYGSSRRAIFAPALFFVIHAMPHAPNQATNAKYPRS